MRNWRDLPKNALLTLDDCAAIVGCSKGTLYGHRYAGLLPFVPGRPVRVQKGDFEIYVQLVSPGNREKLHRSLRIQMEDRASYSCLNRVPDFTAMRPNAIIEEVIRETESIWNRYKKSEEATKPKTAKKRKAA